MGLTTENASAIRIHCAEDVRRAAEFFESIVSATVDFRIGACHDVSSSHPMTDASGHVLLTEVFGWHEPKVHYWSQCGWAMKSPLLLGCRYESEPFWCNARGYFTAVPNGFLSGLDLTNFEARARVKAAIVVPVHMPFGQIGACAYTSRDPEKSDLAAEFEAYGPILGLYGRVFVTSYVQTMGRLRDRALTQRLSRRETQCLRWAALGKTDDDISRILSLSRSTVRFHLTNAASKLDTINRAQTVVKATVLGYISVQLPPLRHTGRNDASAS